MKSVLYGVLVVSSVFSISCTEAAVSDAKMLNLLLCAPNDALSQEASEMANKLIKEAPVPDKGASVPGPVKDGKVCVEKAGLAMAFDVHVAWGQVCGSDIAPVVDWVKKSRPKLKDTTKERKASETNPSKQEKEHIDNVVAIYEEDDEYTITFSKEPLEAALQAEKDKPSPGDNTIYYICAHRYGDGR